MTNMEMLYSLPKDELAYFLMAYSDGCRCCIYKHLKDGRFTSDTWNKCARDEIDDTCVGGYKKWLESEPNSDDKWMFAVCRNNVLIDKWNSMSDHFKDGLKLRYENGLAVEIVDDVDDDIDWIPKPFPF